ncbi:MAG: redox-regulated ATPase YchF [Nitrospinae bacterium]|nr:redox-regulated ATPase YchF [Nitrospinota bacterium]
MRVGIIGLPYTGKTTIFNALTAIDVEEQAHQDRGSEEDHPYSDKPSIRVIKVPDERINILSRIFNPRKITLANITFIDIPGIGIGDEKGGEGRRRYLQYIRDVDILIHVVGLFNDPDSLTPDRDIDTIEMELILTDLEMIENRLKRIEKGSRGSDKKGLEEESILLKRCKETLETEKPLRILKFSPAESILLKGFQFLSIKPTLIILNINEDGMRRDSDIIKKCIEKASQLDTTFTKLCGKIEMEISQLREGEREEFLKDLGLSGSCLSRISKTLYEISVLISFFTVVKGEVKVWTIEKGTNALDAAGVIHSDMRRGFIRAEVIGYDDLLMCGSLAEGRNKGLLRLEGKEYIVKEGDIINFRFNI